MWGNMARLAAEYIFLDQLFDYDAERPYATAASRSSASEPFLKRMAAEDDTPHIIFTAHLGNFELLPIAGAAFGLQVTALFRPPNNPYIADYIFSTRRSTMGELLASRAARPSRWPASSRPAAISACWSTRSSSTASARQFFGRECETSPLLPKLARQYRLRRLSGPLHPPARQPFRLELEEKLELPRNDDGQIDVAATAQLLNDVVERWVREDPGQWMWFHKRWNISAARKTEPAEYGAA